MGVVPFIKGDFYIHYLLIRINKMKIPYIELGMRWLFQKVRVERSVTSLYIEFSVYRGKAQRADRV